MSVSSIEVGSRWLRRQLVRGERRIAVVVTVGAWGPGIVEYRYTKPLRDGFGRGNGKLAPRVNTTVASTEAFLRRFELATVQAILEGFDPDPDHGGYVC